MSPGIAILRALRQLSINNSLKFPSSRLIAGVYQVSHRSLSDTKEKTEEVGEAEAVDPKDRSVKIPVETSIRYLKSRAYAATYGVEPVWVQYRRNFKGSKPPPFTRRTCIKNDKISTGNPCPICRDEYLVLHEQNVDLLKQFLHPCTGDILGFGVTNICRKQHDNLNIAVLRARDQGLLTHHVPFRHYNYEHYIPEELKNKKQQPEQQQQQQQ